MQAPNTCREQEKRKEKEGRKQESAQHGRRKSKPCSETKSPDTGLQAKPPIPDNWY